MTICGVYPDVPGKQANECLPGDEGSTHVEDNDVRVDFTVSVAAGVVFVGRNVSGSVVAAPVSGNVTATIGRADWG